MTVKPETHVATLTADYRLTLLTDTVVFRANIAGHQNGPTAVKGYQMKDRIFMYCYSFIFVVA